MRYISYGVFRMLVMLVLFDNVVVVIFDWVICSGGNFKSSGGGSSVCGCCGV